MIMSPLLDDRYWHKMCKGKQPHPVAALSPTVSVSLQPCTHGQERCRNHGGLDIPYDIATPKSSSVAFVVRML